MIRISVINVTFYELNLAPTHIFSILFSGLSFKTYARNTSLNSIVDCGKFQAVFFKTNRNFNGHLNGFL